MLPLLHAMPTVAADLASATGDEGSSDGGEGEDSGGQTPPDPMLGPRQAAGSLTAGLPTPDSIQRQKEVYVKSLETQLKQGVDMLGSAHKAKTDNLHNTANKRKHDNNVMLNNMLKQQEDMLDRQFEQQSAALKQIAAQRLVELNQQAEALLQALQRGTGTPLPRAHGYATCSKQRLASPPPPGSTGSFTATPRTPDGCGPGAALAAAMRAASVARWTPSSPPGPGGPVSPAGPGGPPGASRPLAPVARYDAPAEVPRLDGSMQMVPALPRCGSSHGPSGALAYVLPSARACVDPLSYVPPTPVQPCTPGRGCRSYVAASPCATARGGSLNVDVPPHRTPSWVRHNTQCGSLVVPQRVLPMPGVGQSLAGSMSSRLNGSLHVPLGMGGTGPSWNAQQDVDCAQCPIATPSGGRQPAPGTGFTALPPALQPSHPVGVAQATVEMGVSVTPPASTKSVPGFLAYVHPGAVSS